MDNPERQVNALQKFFNFIRGDHNNPSGGSNSAANSNKKAPINFGWASSEMEEETFNFQWTLKNFSALKGLPEVKSPVFKGGSGNSHSWHLKVIPKAMVGGTEYCGIYLGLVSLGDDSKNPLSPTKGSSKDSPLKVRFQVSVFDSEGKPLIQKLNHPAADFLPGTMWGYEKYVTTQELNSPSKGFLTGDTVRMHCEIRIQGKVKHITGTGSCTGSGTSIELSEMPNETLAEIKFRGLSLLSKDMKALQTQWDLADVSVATKSSSFLAHKNILAARSSVFHAMFRSQMLESAENVIEILDFEEDVVKAMLDYIYGGEVPASVMQEIAPDLLAISDKYELLGLKVDCENYIASKLTVENAAEILVLAHLHSASKLNRIVIQFINSNKEKVQKTEAFKNLARDKPAVVVDLYLSAQ